MSHHHHHNQCCAHTNLKFCSCCNTAYCVDCGYEWKNRVYNSQWYYPYGSATLYGQYTYTNANSAVQQTLSGAPTTTTTTTITCAHKPDANL